MDVSSGVSVNRTPCPMPSDTHDIDQRPFVQHLQIPPSHENLQRFTSRIASAMRPCEKGIPKEALANISFTPLLHCRDHEGLKLFG